MNIIIVSNIRDGKGLARDARILAARLWDLGHVPTVVDFRDDVGGRYDRRFDLAFHLEHVELRLLDRAPRNWYVPNAEWHTEGAQEALRGDRFERVLCKTRHAEKIFANLTDRAIFTGFESEDRRLLDVPRERVFLHARGGSDLKGTDAVLEAARQQGGTVVLPVRMPDDEFRREQNRCLFHLCPSEYEGWGHGIHEALSVGALVVTTDAPPMADVPGVALRIEVDRREPLRMIERSIVSASAVRAAMIWCASLSEEEIANMRARARMAYEAETWEFRGILAGLMAEARR